MLFSLFVVDDVPVTSEAERLKGLLRLLEFLEGGLLLLFFILVEVSVFVT